MILVVKQGKPRGRKEILIKSYQDDDDNLIMSVDDDFVNQEVMRSILEPCGFKSLGCTAEAWPLMPFADQS